MTHRHTISGPPKHCAPADYSKDCACWACIKFLHLSVVSSLFDIDRREIEREAVEEQQEAA